MGAFLWKMFLRSLVEVVIAHIAQSSFSGLFTYSWGHLIDMRFDFDFISITYGIKMFWKVIIDGELLVPFIGWNLTWFGDLSRRFKGHNILLVMFPDEDYNQLSSHRYRISIGMLIFDWFAFAREIYRLMSLVQSFFVDPATCIKAYLHSHYVK